MRVSRMIAVLALVVTGSAAVVAAKAQPAESPYAIYRLGTPDLTRDQVNLLARRLKLRELQIPPTAESPYTLFTKKGEAIKLLYDRSNGSVKLFPDLKSPSQRALRPEKTVAQAAEWLRKNGLLPADAATLQAGEVITLAQQPATPRKVKPRRDVLRTVHYYRQRDGLRIFGPNSRITVQVSNQGTVGLDRSLLPLTQERTPADILTSDEATRMFHGEFDQYLARLYPAGPPPTTVLGMDLIYYEQGQEYVQPAYRFNVRIDGPNNARSSLAWLVPAARQAPEPIINVPRVEPEQLPVEPQIPEQVGIAAADTHYGMYVVREDYEGWSLDAAAFRSRLDSSNALLRFVISGYPATINDQYYWNHPWLWEAWSSEPDYSSYYVGAVDTVLIEGHGAPWLITTLKDCCDVIDLPAITGYGAYNGHGGKTDYIIWQSCDVIPAPGDPYAGNYTSPHSPFDVWFGIFKGMRGNYGYRTLMHVYNGAGGLCGNMAGLGVPMLNSWFYACDNNVFGHSGGFNLGSAVIITGHENDRIYDNTPLPTPGSLTLWWQYL